ncbi:response regulator [Acidipropionibacterium virtanenii]|uniref:response regulator n=1 Tax=Acidipropionibacterium virtanenii TaxID=2057246 RepID=UPI000DECD765|nr:response regulator transcription factor [Acidipropionibacterium virtanenii]
MSKNTDEHDAEGPVAVAVVDDDALVRSGLRLLLEGPTSGIRIVGEASDGDEATDLVAECDPRIVLMDIRMARMDGIEATRRLLAGDDPPRVIMLTTFDADDMVLRALVAGAHGFLLKDTAPGRMIEMIHAVASGEYTLSPSVLRSVITAATSEMTDPRRVEARRALEGLNRREHEIALGVAEGLSNAQIAGRMYLSVPTVKAALTRILANLGLSSRVQLAILVHDAG